MYNDLGQSSIATQTQQTLEEITYHQYLNILENPRIDDEKRKSLEYIHLIEHDKHKNTWVKYLIISWDA